MPKSQQKSALEKALAVLEAISDQPQPVGPPDLAARLQLPRATVHRVLGQLERSRLVVRDRSRERYSVGPRISKLAFATMRSLNHTAPIRVILRELVGEVGETCNVGVLDGLDYVYLQRIECHWPLRLRLEIGTRLSAHAVSGGKMLLASLDPQQRKTLLRGQQLQAFTKRTITTIAGLDAELARIHARNYALNNQEHIDGIVGAAVPIVDPKGNVLAALGMQGPMPRLTLDMSKQHVPRMRIAAQRIADVWSV